MSTNPETLRLLLLMQSATDADVMVGMIRNYGCSTRATHAATLDAFAQYLEQQSWDVVITEQDVDHHSYKDMLQHVKKSGKDLPVIVLSQDIDPILSEECLKSGAAACVSKGENNLLVLTVQRELEARLTRKKARQLEVELSESQSRCQSLLEETKEPVAYIIDGMHTFANVSYLELFGYQSIDDLAGVSMFDLICHQDQDNFKQFLKSFHDGDAETNRISCSGFSSNGDEFSMHVHLFSSTYGDEDCTQVIIKKQKSKDSNYVPESNDDMLTLYDGLTSLNSYSHFKDLLDRAFKKAALRDIESILLYIHIDRFYQIRSDHGFTGSDTLLASIAETLNALLGDQKTLSRVADDGFALILTGFTQEQALENAELIRDHIEHAFVELNDRTLTATASIGLASMGAAAKSADQVLQHAFSAAHSVRQQQGKERGNGVYYYAESSVLSTESEKDLSTLLEQALKENTFELLFQPIINLTGDESEHYEALLRMPHNDESISAREFMLGTVIDETLKRKIDRWVVLNATKMLSEHCEKGNNTRVFINLSSASLSDEALGAWLEIVLKTASLPKESVIFQFCEEDAHDMLKQAQRFTEYMKKIHISTAINRFGCALKPFNTLQHLGVDYVKIDGSFTRELNKNDDAQDLLEKLISELQDAGKKTIVPLVENAVSVSSLWQIGVDFIQGYYVQAPQAKMDYNFDDEG